jgi:uncharacterized membrane protein
MTTTNFFYEMPSVSNSLSAGWKKMMDQFLPLLLIIIICAILQSPAKFSTGDWNFNMWNVMLIPVMLAYGFLFWPIIDFSSDFLFLKAIRSQKVEIIEMVANLLKIALIIMGFIMLIIPGIIIACRLAFVSYLVMDKNLEPMEAIEQSWKMTRGYGWKVFFLWVVSIFIFIAGILMVIVGVFISLVWINAAFAALYQSIQDYRLASETLPILAVDEQPDTLSR